MGVLEVVFLGIVQGVTEFFPVSSSGHLLILPQLFGWQQNSLAFDAMLHFGTTIAILFYFRRELTRIIKGFFLPKNLNDSTFGWKLLLSTLPAIIVASVFKDSIETVFRNPSIVAVSLFVWAIGLLIADRIKNDKPRDMKDLSFVDALFIGCAQAVALVPGTSRSGITIIAGITRKLSREQAVIYSFFMGIPVLLGASMISLFDLVRLGDPHIQSFGMIFLALLVTFFSGLFAIHFLLRFVKKGALTYFAIYRILLAILLIL